MNPLDELIQAERIDASNTTAQEIATNLLEMATRVEGSCECTPLTNSTLSKILRDLACLIDERKVIWSWNIDEIARASGLHASQAETLKRAEKIANRERQRVAVKDAGDWREPLGFEPNEVPTEEELDQAFKQRARETHPDLGGNQEEFIEARKAHDRAKEELFGKKPPSKVSASPGPDDAAPGTLFRCDKCHKPLL